MKLITNITKYLKSITSLKGSHYKTAAVSPRQFSLKDWRYALLETKNAIASKNLGILAAGIAYFATLAFFPLMAAAVAISAFVIDGNQLKDILHTIEVYLPADIASLIGTQLETALKDQSANIAVAVIAIFLSLFSVSGATQNAITGTNTMYDLKESRNFIILKLTSLVLTIGTLFIAFIAIGLLVINEEMLRHFGVPHILATLFPYVRWVILAALVTVSLAVFYRYGPDRKNPKWQWVSWGAVIAAAIWLLGTTLFFVYAQYFANFSDTYSLFAGIIVLMTWLNLSASIILLGAAINHRLEARTVRRTTTK